MSTRQLLSTTFNFESHAFENLRRPKTLLLNITLKFYAIQITYNRKLNWEAFIHCSFRSESF